jgi:hypothetical protein
MFDFLRRSSPHSSTGAIRQALVLDGVLSTPGALPAFDVVESRGRYDGRRVRYFRAFDPARTAARGLTIRSYRDLSAHPGLLLRTGHVEEDGSVVVDYRGPAMDAAIPVRERADRAAHTGDERFVFPETFRAGARWG